MSNELLKVNIQKKLKEFDLNVDFELKKGCLGILGPSGCGKSMTLKSVAGIVNPDNGVISLTTNDETVYYDSNEKINLKPQKRNVGYLFQNYALFPNMTVEENVAIGLPKDYDDIPFLASSKRTEISSFEKVIFSFFAFSIKARTRGIISSELFPSESFWKSFKSLSFFSSISTSRI